MRASPRWFLKLLISPATLAAILLSGLVVAASVAMYLADGQPAARSMTVTQGERQLRLFAMGDWGADTDAQRRVASAMAAEARKKQSPLEAVLLLGDNFYVDLPSTETPAWRTLFEEMYDRANLAVPFYAVLGNNDCEESKPQVQLDYARLHPRSRWKMPARWYRIELPEVQPLATILMLDSNVAEMSPQQWSDELQWLTQELAAPRTTPWLIVAAHHPLYSSGKHGSDPRLLRDWGPLFEAAKVDFYLSGHDHDLEHIHREGESPDFVIAGGGGADLRAVASITGSRFAEESHGFFSLVLGERSADATFVDDSGMVVHSFARRVASTQPAGM